MTHTIKSRYDADDANRQGVLNQARLCAALSKPWVLPPIGQTANSKLPENYQSIGSRGITNLEGKMLLALYPPAAPWFRFRPAPKLRFNQQIPAKVLQEMERRLYLHELLLQSLLESANIDEKTSRRQRRSGFRTRKRMALSQVLVTGDALEQLTSDYRLKTFRRDQYVTKRDSTGEVLYHIVRETLDPKSLSTAIVAKAKLPDGIMDKPVAERMQNIYTLVEWQPLTKTWLICQEINGNKVAESEEPVSPYFSTPFELAPGEDYGRGFVELNIGDLRSTNELERRLLDFAELASKQLPAIDYNSMVRPEDLAKPTGTPFRARVTGGQVQDVGMLKADKITDFKVVYQTLDRKHKELGKAMLLESEVQPRGDRVTRFQVERVALELDGALGGFYAPIADDQQVPLLQRLVYQAKKDKLLPALPDGAVEAEPVTGIAALSREIDAAKLMSALGALGQMPNALARIDIGIAAEIVMRHTGIYEAGLVKTDEQMEKEKQQQMRDVTAMAADQKAIEAFGNAAEQQMTAEGANANG